MLKTLTSEHINLGIHFTSFLDNLYSEQNWKIYKCEWHVVFSRSEERDVAQGVGRFSQRVHLTYTTTPLYLQGKKFPCLQK